MTRTLILTLWSSLGLWLSACTTSLVGEWEGDLDCGGADIDFVFELEADSGEFVGEGEIGEFTATSDGYTYDLLVPFELTVAKEKAFGEQELDVEVDDCEVLFVDYGQSSDLDCDDPDDVEWDGADEMTGTIKDFLGGGDCDFEVSR